MTLIIFIVGDIGGGKTTLAKALALVARESAPNCPIVSNVQLGIGQKVDDVNKWLGLKIIKEDQRYAFVVVDEAAQAGFESRGSGSRSAAVESRLITMARKVRIDMVIVTQLASMIDKRAQWQSAFTILCEPWFAEDNKTPTPDFFDYTVYDSHMREINEFSISSADAATWIWPGMDTDDIPLRELLKAQLLRYYDVKPQDEGDFEEVMVNATK